MPTHGYVKDSTIQQTIFSNIGMDERPCMRRKYSIVLGDSSNEMPTGQAARIVAEYDYCPDKG